MLRNIPSQESILYDQNWNFDTDACFINTLIAQKLEGNWTPGVLNGHALLMAHGVLKERYCVELSWDDIVKREKLLQQRYDTMTSVMCADGFWWDRVDDKVYAEGSVWRSMIKANPFASVYYHQGEPDYDNLKMLYGSTVASEPQSIHEVINISDGSIPNAPIPEHVSRTVVQVSDDEDEVVSPILNDNKKRSRIFRGSSRLSETSSCASTSPVKWFHFPDKKN